MDSFERPDAAVAAVLRSSFDQIDVTDDDAVGCGEGDGMLWTSKVDIGFYIADVRPPIISALVGRP